MIISESETLAISTTTAERLAVAQRQIERIMLSISLRRWKSNIYIRHQIGVKHINQTIKKWKYRWAGHVSHLRDNSWTIRATIRQRKITR